MATLANDGVIMRPHLVKKKIDTQTGEETFVAKEPVGVIPLKKEHLLIVRSAMREVTRSGTAKLLFKEAKYDVAGKTGTAQVLGIKQGAYYDKDKVKERYRDHALFIAYAPYRKPKIALAVLVENGGFGATTAVPLARKIMDYYLLEDHGKSQEAEAAAKKVKK